MSSPYARATKQRVRAGNSYERSELELDANSLLRHKQYLRDMTSSKPKIIVVVGPTASGKTSLSIELAKMFDGEVISADSRQVYKALDIGTEKVSKDDMEDIPHHLIDVVDINTVYNVSDFKRDASLSIEKITKKKKLPIVAGGTFFYIDALLGRIATPEVPPDLQLRAHLEEMSIESLHHSLEELDPARAFEIGPHNKRRIIRALEIVKSLGKVPAETQQECPFEVLMIGIAVDKKVLRERIAKRAQEALTRGLVVETQKILGSGTSRERLSEIGLEYRLVMDYLDGNLTDLELIQKMEEKNWQYAKRQRTWLKRDLSIKWFERTDIGSITDTVQSFLHD